MRLERVYVLVLCCLMLGRPAAGREDVAGSPSADVVAAISQPVVRELVAEVLAANHGLGAAAARARGAANRSLGISALPNPTASVGAFLAGPETRTGPQRLSVGLSQRLPWPGKLGLEKDAADEAAAALVADVEAVRLRLITETRRLAYELAFLGQQRAITQSFRAHLEQHEEIARARYSTGVGLGHGVVKLQAELTRVDSRLLEIEARQTELLARLNAMRDREASALVPSPELPELAGVEISSESLVERALATHPEIAAAEARARAAERARGLAELRRRPDFSVGLMYTLVERRDDAAGLAQPPEGNGDDVFGIQGGVTIPLWRKSLAAGVDEAIEQREAARRELRSVTTAVRARVADLSLRLALSIENLRLVEELLITQAEEALELAEAAYIGGTFNALDLLDAEHVLFQARVARARAAADALIGLAELEGATARPLETLPAMPEVSDRGDVHHEDS